MAKRLGSKFWQGQLKAWERSGLTQVAYCAANELSIKSFSRWRSRALVATADFRSRDLTLVPVSVGEPARRGVVQLHSPGGWRIEVPEGNAPWLSELLRRLP